jgi:hypothetical protein
MGSQESHDYDLSVPETIEFGTSKPKAASTQIEIHHPGRWSMTFVPLQGISLNREVRSVADREIVSGLRGGTLRFNDTSWPQVQLTENELLSISHTDKARIQIRSADDSMQVTLDGQVANVSIGDSNAHQQIAPSYLEYLYNTKSIFLFWTAVGAGWGLLWGIRKTVFR